MRRVVVTGMGIISSIGTGVDEVRSSLREAKSGITFSESFAEHGFRSQVWGDRARQSRLFGCNPQTVSGLEFQSRYCSIRFARRAECVRRWYG